MSKLKRLDMPPIVSGPFAHALGHFWHVIRPGDSQDVVKVSEVHISPRCKETLYSLADGAKIIVTARRQIKERPADVDGVLRVSEEGKANWLWNKGLEEFSAEVAKKGWERVAREINASWQGQFNYRSEIQDRRGKVVQKGLRPPQIGGLHAIGAHWSLYHQPATVVMPTGTGKTETMLAALATFVQESLLVVVPSRVLRDQTARKFASFGLLRELGNFAKDARNPIVGIITKRPTSEADLDLFAKCNVVITTMAAIGGGEAAAWSKHLAERVGTLIVDEAHHIGAEGWAAFREYFVEQRVLQFTATPFRRDGKLVDGKVIYNYPLQLAQRDGYFKKISFEPVYEIDEENADRTIAAAAVDRLRADIAPD